MKIFYSFILCKKKIDKIYINGVAIRLVAILMQHPMLILSKISDILEEDLRFKTKIDKKNRNYFN